MPVMIPEGFGDMIGRAGIPRAEELIRSLDLPSPVSIRFNPFKTAQKPDGRNVPWCRYGFYLEERPVFTLDPFFHGGLYYVQEPSSMFLDYVCERLLEDHDNATVLDLCAAPGGKTTLLASRVGLQGLVIANETIRSRSLALAENVKKWGLGNTVVTNNDPSHFASFRNFFDLVLVDAPCSGEGMFRKNPKSREQWSVPAVNHCAERQRRILADVWESVRPGGYLVYSTCTFNNIENEYNIEWLCREFGCSAVHLDIPLEWGIVKGTTAAGVETFRFLPHMLQGEGLFMAVVRKESFGGKTVIPKHKQSPLSDLARNNFKTVSRLVGQPEYMTFGCAADQVYGYYSSVYETIRKISCGLNIIYSGVGMGQMVRGELKPAPSLALFHDIHFEQSVELDHATALDYLRKADISPMLFSEGLNLVKYEGMPLGWIKRIGNRCNNLYPKESRIMNL